MSQRRKGKHKKARVHLENSQGCPGELYKRRLRKEYTVILILPPSIMESVTLEHICVCRYPGICTYVV